VGTAGVLGDVASDRTRRFARRIRSVKKAERSGDTIQGQVDYAWLDRRAAILGVNRDYALEPMQSQQYDIVRERTARETCPGAAGDKGCSGGGKQTDDLDCLLPRSWEHSEARLPTVSGEAVRIVDEELARASKDKPLADDADEVICQSLSRHE
jgi:hypothetical protein